MKRYFKLIICILLVFGLCACGKKTALNNEAFYEKLTSLGFSVIDGTSLSEDENIKTIYTANNGKYQFEYYQFVDAKTALEAYNGNKEQLILKTRDGKEETKENYIKYISLTDNDYISVIKLDNTMIYVYINKEYKDDIEKVLSKIGY